jgi:DNA-binding NarL/FixJ family response regulator
VIRVFLVDDHTAFRQPFAFMLERDPEVRVVASTGSIADARKQITEFDVTVLDLDLPDGDGAALVPELLEASPGGGVLVLTASTDRAEVARCIRSGAACVMHKSAGFTEIAEAVRRVAAGEHLHSPREVVELLRFETHLRETERDAQAALVRLSAREREVLQLLAEGLSDREIAERLVVGTETVRTHMVNILNKLGVHSRLQALVFAARHGAVEI